MTRIWPAGFSRVPDDDWVSQPPETLALTYDTVQDHGSRGPAYSQHLDGDRSAVGRDMASTRT